MCLNQINFAYLKELFQQRDERNLISATFHMLSITLICMSMGDLSWFIIDGNVCVPYLTLGEFFWFGYSTTGIDYREFDCLDSLIVNMMRIIILLCFMAIIFALLGFFLDIIGPRAPFYRMLRRFCVPGAATIIFIMTIAPTSYLVMVLLQHAIEDENPKSYYDISYGFGFYLITFAGGIQALGLIYNLVLPYKTSYQDDDRCLIDGFDDMRDFQCPTPPPPYCLPPPPYTP
ncbi:unnamed protein product [Ceutorhynchus assimilis]|uniref:Transmembrane protein 127 transmembrane region domain-containing protein n=1 Tax=Ceutorhynchus assimilis TaxID=467358 RepID=A0A9N9MXG4_9CUCU|nr:unnamed protein product [Ceutorhynchus assimilis]